MRSRFCSMRGFAVAGAMALAALAVLTAVAAVPAGGRRLPWPIPQPDHVALGDLFGTGQPVVVAAFETWNATEQRSMNGIYYALQLDAGALRIRWKSPTEDARALDRDGNNLTVARFPADARPALLAARGRAVRRWVWDGTGFAEQPALALPEKDGPPQRITALAAADLDGDGNPEVVTAVSFEQAAPHAIVAGFQWDGARWDERWETRPLPGRVREMARVAGPGARGDELVFVLDGPTDRLWRLAPARGREPYAVPIPAVYTVSGLAAIDRPGRPPLVALAGQRASRPVIALLALGAKAATLEREVVLEPGPIGRLLAGDLDGDGRAELLATRGGDLVVIPLPGSG